MAEQRLIDATDLIARGNASFGGVSDAVLLKKFVDAQPTIYPETLPVVRQLRNELARVTAERDAAIEDLRGDCGKCSHFNVIYNGCTPDFDCPLLNKCLNTDMWEWRGQQKEE